MAIELATAYLTLVPSLKGAAKGIESQLGGIDVTKAGSKMGRSLGDSMGRSLDLTSAGRKLDDFGSKMSSAGSTLTAGLTVPLATAGVAAGAFALKTASAAEQTEISFTTMLGSAEAAEKMMSDLADFAAHTPFELSGLQTATRQLLAYGFTAEDVVPMLTAVGDATAALGTGQAGIEAVTRALGQMQTRGKVSAEEMLQLTEAGIPAWEYLAKAIGTDTAGAMDAVSRGAVDASTGIAALTKGMEEDFGGMMEAQSKTLTGLMSNLSDAIEKPLMQLKDTAAYESLARALQHIVDAAGPFVESLMPHLESGLRGLSGILDAAAGAMEGFAGMSMEGQEQAISLLAVAVALGPAFVAIGKASSAVGKGMRVASAAMKAAQKIVDRLASSSADSADGLSGVAAESKTATSGTRKMTSATKAQAAASKLASSATSMLGTALAGMGVAAAVAAISALVGALIDAGEHERLVEEATRSASSVIAESASSAQTAATGMSAASASADSLFQSMADLNAEVSDTYGELAANSALLDQHMAVIEQLAGKTGLTADEQARLKAAVEGYNSVTGETVEVTDAANGKLSVSTGELDKNAEAWKRNAKAQAAQEFLKDAYSQQMQAAKDLAAAQDTLAQKQEAYNSALQAYNEEYARTADESSAQMVSGLGRAEAELTSAKQKVDEYGRALGTANENVDYFTGQTEILAAALGEELTSALSGLPPQLQTLGINAASSLQAGISAGTVGAQEAADFLSQAVKGPISTLPTDMQDEGMQAVGTLSQAIANGQVTASQASDILKAAVTGNISTLPADLQGYAISAANLMGVSLQNGTAPVSGGAAALNQAALGGVAPVPGELSATGAEGGQGLAAALGEQRGRVESSAKSLADATESAKNNNGNARGWGSELGGNFAAGIRGMAKTVGDAAASLAGKVASFLHFTEPDEGPLVGINDSGYELARNYAKAMLRGEPLVAAAAESLAGSARFEPGIGAPRSAAVYRAASTDGPQPADILMAIYRALPSMIRDNSPSSLTVDGREFARAVRRYA